MITKVISPDDKSTFIDENHFVLLQGRAVTITFESDLGDVTEITSDEDLPTGLSIVDNTITGTPSTQSGDTNYKLTFNTGEIVYVSICVIPTTAVRRIECGKYRVYNYSPSETLTVQITDSASNVLLNNLSIPPQRQVSYQFSTDGIYIITLGEAINYVVVNLCATNKCFTEAVKAMLCKDCNCSKDKVKIYNFNKLSALRDTLVALLDSKYTKLIPYSNQSLDEEIADFATINKTLALIKEQCDITSKDNCNCNH